jgi:hypothetical protein
MKKTYIDNNNNFREVFDTEKGSPGSKVLTKIKPGTPSEFIFSKNVALCITIFKAGAKLKSV